ncbi:hypothetical protein PUN28_017588 [Cardiocondyla obscurior]
MLIPFTVLAKPKSEKLELQAQVVIAGDPYQLEPVVRCNKIKHLLGKSMMERLMNNCDIYKKQDGKYNPNYITKLVKNYRSHESFLHVSNQLFYEDDLQACGGAETQIMLNWLQLPNKNFPLIFQEVYGTESRTESNSVFNTVETVAVLTYVNILLKRKFKNCKIKPQDIGIITPFKQQELDISFHLASMNLQDITVGTVETFQGQERKIIIISAVRSIIFKHNDQEHIGFLSHEKRFNVALTRAESLVIMIGNPDILCVSKPWNLLWTYCKDNNACIPYKHLPLDEIVKKKLECKMRQPLSKNKLHNKSSKLSLTKWEKKKLGTTLTVFDTIEEQLKNLKLEENEESD